MEQDDFIILSVEDEEESIILIHKPTIKENNFALETFEDKMLCTRHGCMMRTNKISRTICENCMAYKSIEVVYCSPECKQHHYGIHIINCGKYNWHK
jgi:hypothetical protein